MNTNENLKVVISGGGTGGHIFPAIAIADALKRRFPKADILFIGAKGRMEMERVPKAGYPIEGLWISGFTKEIKSLLLPLKLTDSFNRAIAILKRFKPDVVIGVGGFASGPTLMAANFLRIPTIIQEQNSYPGKTNRNVGKKAKAICVAYDHLDQWFPAEKIHFTGNPLRTNITLNGTREEAAAFFSLDATKPVALLVGGSQGALGINKGISAQLAAFKDSDLQLIWQTGKTYITQAQEEVKALGLENHKAHRVFSGLGKVDLHGIINTVNEQLDRRVNIIDHDVVVARLEAFCLKVFQLLFECLEPFLRDIVGHAFGQICPHRHPRNLFLIAFFYEASTHWYAFSFSII